MQELANLSKLENSLRLHLKTKIVRKNAIKNTAENAKTAQLQTQDNYKLLEEDH